MHSQGWLNVVAGSNSIHATHFSSSSGVVGSNTESARPCAYFYSQLSFILMLNIIAQKSTNTTFPTKLVFQLEIFFCNGQITPTLQPSLYSKNRPPQRFQRPRKPLFSHQTANLLPVLLVSSNSVLFTY